MCYLHPPQAFLQLTGSEISRDMMAEEMTEELQNAFAGRNVLLILDDVWETPHAALVNVIDKNTGSKVLISSRVRGVLEGGLIVDISMYGLTFSSPFPLPPQSCFQQPAHYCLQHSDLKFDTLSLSLTHTLSLAHSLSFSLSCAALILAVFLGTSRWYKGRLTKMHCRSCSMSLA